MAMKTGGWGKSVLHIDIGNAKKIFQGHKSANSITINSSNTITDIGGDISRNISIPYGIQVDEIHWDVKGLTMNILYKSRGATLEDCTRNKKYLERVMELIPVGTLIECDFGGTQNIEDITLILNTLTGVLELNQGNLMLIISQVGHMRQLGIYTPEQYDMLFSEVKDIPVSHICKTLLQKWNTYFEEETQNIIDVSAIEIISSPEEEPASKVTLIDYSGEKKNGDIVENGIPPLEGSHKIIPVIKKIKEEVIILPEVLQMINEIIKKHQLINNHSFTKSKDLTLKGEDLVLNQRNMIRLSQHGVIKFNTLSQKERNIIADEINEELSQFQITSIIA